MNPTNQKISRRDAESAEKTREKKGAEPQSVISMQSYKSIFKFLRILIQVICIVGVGWMEYKEYKEGVEHSFTFICVIVLLILMTCNLIGQLKK